MNAIFCDNAILPHYLSDSTSQKRAPCITQRNTETLSQGAACRYHVQSMFEAVGNQICNTFELGNNTSCLATFTQLDHLTRTIFILYNDALLPQSTT